LKNNLFNKCFQLYEFQIETLTLSEPLGAWETNADTLPFPAAYFPSTNSLMDLQTTAKDTVENFFYKKRHRQNNNNTFKILIF